MTQLILTRHGQTEWNRMPRFRGRADIPLNDVGMAQAKATARRIRAGWTPTAIYTSPMGRAVTTAEIIGAEIGLSAQPMPQFTDIDYGAWQGHTDEEVKARWPEAYETWRAQPQWAVIPEGETLAAVQERVAGVVRDVVERHPDETIVLVGHDCVNRVLLLYALTLPLDRYWHLGQDNCAINVLRAAGNDFDVLSINETWHTFTP